MIIKDIDDKKRNFRLLIEEQKIGNVVYRISDAYAPSLGNVSSRVSVSKINEEDDYNHEETHGLDFSEGELQSYFLIDDKNRSTVTSYFLDNPDGYYDEVFSKFEELVNSGMSEFTTKALDVLYKIKSYADQKSREKNAI